MTRLLYPVLAGAALLLSAGVYGVSQVSASGIPRQATVSTSRSFVTARPVPGAVVRHVAVRLPVAGGRSIEFGAARPAMMVRHERLRVSPAANQWTQLATLPGAVVHDISFPTAKVGYAAAELGQVWKTTNGGMTWKEIVNVGFPYYWYGVTALGPKDVVVSGFNDSTMEGIVRWSRDGGVTWTSDIVLTTTGWSYRVRFANPKDGLVVDGLNTAAPNAAHYTTDGGAVATDWTEDVPDPNGGWFGNEFSLLSNGHAVVAGITYCASGNIGQTWACRPSVDSVFDGAVDFVDNKHGWDGGGEISPDVAGWVHRTSDGGKHWSGRTLQSDFPIREIRFITAKVGWAAGGNIYSNVGGIYFSADGGKTWSLDLNTNGNEMDACDSRMVSGKHQIWCAGYDDSLNGVVYTTTY
jgi:photosystem II stability/assembly factor-like uncharacterized protein